MNDLDAQLRCAESIARKAHGTVVDKAGEPYWKHPCRVAGKLEDPRAKVVGWLHDVLEDTDVTESSLREKFSSEIVDAVVALSKNRSASTSAYFEAIRANPLALAVKVADIHDNLEPRRLARLTPAWQFSLMDKYGRALIALAQWPGGPKPEEPPVIE